MRGAYEQLGAEAALELGDGAGQRRLGDAEALGGAADVRLLGDGDEVAQLAGLHSVERTPLTRRSYLRGIGRDRIGLGAARGRVHTIEA